MGKIKYKISFYIILGILSIGLLSYLYIFQKELVSSNFAVAVVTLVVGGVAIYLYITQKKENKRDAAKIIVQEIRRAEDIISDYKKTGSYQFARKIIPTNSWAKIFIYL